MHRFALVVAVASLSVSAAHAQSQHGALAVDRNNGFFYGFAYDQPSREAAESRAMSEARERGGTPSIVLSWAGSGCGAYRTVPAESGTAYGWGLAGTRAEAESIAISELGERSGGASGPNHVWGCNSDTAAQRVFVSEPVNLIPSVRIGSQTWTSVNLRANRTAAGAAIPKLADNDAFVQATRAGRPGYMFADGKEDFGYRYNLPAAQQVCPTGWRLPTQGDWEQLATHLGGPASARTALLRTGRSGFNADLAGYGWTYDTYITEWWTSTEAGGPNYVYRAQINREVLRFADRSPWEPGFVRCIKQ